MASRTTRRNMLQASGRLVVRSSAALGLLAAACTTVQRPWRLSRVEEGCGAPIVVTVSPALAEGAAAWILEALPAACARLARFSLALGETTEIRLHADRRSFSRATRKRAAWLRAWTGFDVVHLLPPTVWRDDSAAARLERLVHELCHAAFFQRFGDEERARRARLPFWFLEGSASAIAGQAPRRMPLALVVERAGDDDPLRDRGWLACDHHVAYGAAHHAVSFLVARHDEGVIARMLEQAVSDGQPGCAERALERVCGLAEGALWPALVAQARAKAGTSMRPSNSTPRAWHTAL